MDDLTLTEVIAACELKWRYNDVDEARFMTILVSLRHPGYTGVITLSVLLINIVRGGQQVSGTSPSDTDYYI